MKKLLVGIMVVVMVVSILLGIRVCYVKTMSNEELVARYLSNTYDEIVYRVDVWKVSGDEVCYDAYTDRSDYLDWRCYTSRAKMEYLLFIGTI